MPNQAEHGLPTRVQNECVQSLEALLAEGEEASNCVRSNCFFHAVLRVSHINQCSIFYRWRVPISVRGHLAHPPVSMEGMTTSN
jgi:hypothetical protein